MLNITHFQRNAIPTTMLYHTGQNGHHQKKKKKERKKENLQTINARGVLEKREPSCTVGGDVN